MDIKRALEIKKHYREITRRERLIARLAVERYNGIDRSPEQLLDQFDALADWIPIFLENPTQAAQGETGPDLPVALRKYSGRTPQLSVVDEGGPPYVKLSIYTPSDTNLNSIEISAFWAIYPEGHTFDPAEHAIKTFETEHVKRDWLDPNKPQFKGYEGSAAEEKRRLWLIITSTLDELEKSVGSFADRAFNLTPNSARAKNFSEDFISLLEKRNL